MASWQPYSKEFVAGTKLVDIATAILEEEFGNVEYHLSLGFALVDGIGEWRDASARAAFIGRKRQSDKVLRKLKNAFGTATCPTSISQPVQGPGGKAKLPRMFFCPLTLDVMVDPVVAMDSVTY